LLEDEIEKSLFEDSDFSSSSEYDDSSGNDDLTVGEVIVSEQSGDEESDVQCVTTPSAPCASHATFT
jgi:hypothetical protein